MLIQATNHAVIIPSTGRPAVLLETLQSVLRQRPLPDQIIVIVAAECDIPPLLLQLDRVQVFVGRRGGASQRNDGIDRLRPDVDFITFLDDDMELDYDYLRQARFFLQAHADVAIVNGRLLKDGNVNRSEAQELLLLERQNPQPVMDAYASNAYGHNLTVRRSVAAVVRFDERFRLYSWLEDFDFGKRSEKYGRCVSYSECKAVHLQTQLGRVSGKLMGFSQIMNPCYLRQKGIITRSQLLCRFLIPALRNNLAGWLLFDHKVDRLGRLQGNLAALSLLARGRCEPEYVENLR